MTDLPTTLSSAQREIAKLRKAIAELESQMAERRATFCAASPGSEEEFTAWLQGFDHATEMLRALDAKVTE